MNNNNKIFYICPKVICNIIFCKKEFNRNEIITNTQALQNLNSSYYYCGTNIKAIEKHYNYINFNLLKLGCKVLKDNKDTNRSTLSIMGESTLQISTINTNFSREVMFSHSRDYFKDSSVRILNYYPRCYSYTYTQVPDEIIFTNQQTYDNQRTKYYSLQLVEYSYFYLYRPSFKRVEFISC